MKITQKGQVTIPAHIQDRLGLMPNSEVDFVEKDGRIYLVKARKKSKKKRFRKFRGIATVKLQFPKEALFLAGKAFLQYKKREDRRSRPLPDFFIGTHSAISQFLLVTTDVKRYRTYFTTVELIHPS